MTATERTMRRKPSPTAAIQNKNGLANVAQRVLTIAQQEAYDRGVDDFEKQFRDHPPYGFTDLQMAWRAGWLHAKQKAEGLNSGRRASLDGKSA